MKKLKLFINLPNWWSDNIGLVSVSYRSRIGPVSIPYQSRIILLSFSYRSRFQKRKQYGNDM